MYKCFYVRLCQGFVCFAIYSSSVEGRKYHISKRLVCGASLDALLKSLLRISEGTCVDECVWRPSCNALDYSGRLKLCKLYSRADIELVKGHCIYLKRTDISIDSTCNGICNEGEVCDKSTNECVISECKPLILENGSFHGNLNDIGSIKREVCHNKFGDFTMPHPSIPPFTCQANGTWSRQSYCMEPYNVALGKPVEMSSLWVLGSAGSLMVNGNTSGLWVCACTQREPTPWAIVDLLEDHVVFAFYIYNRRDCCPERLHDLEIYIGNSTDLFHFCYKHVGFLDPVMQTIVVNDVCFGRYIKLQISEGHGYSGDTGPGHYLTICELQVFGNLIQN